jgi:hypothetical protein
MAERELPLQLCILVSCGAQIIAEGDVAKELAGAIGTHIKVMRGES